MPHAATGLVPSQRVKRICTGHLMIEKITSTWLIVAFLLGAMFLMSFLPSHSTSEDSLLLSSDVHLEGGLSDQIISKVEQETSSLNAQ